MIGQRQTPMSIALVNRGSRRLAHLLRDLCLAQRKAARENHIGNLGALRLKCLGVLRRRYCLVKSSSCVKKEGEIDPNEVVLRVKLHGALGIGVVTGSSAAAATFGSASAADDALVSEYGTIQRRRRLALRPW